jgi:hypothetical protein
MYDESGSTQRARSTRAERAEWVARFRASGQPARIFADAAGLRLATLLRWQREADRDDAPGDIQTVGLGELLGPAPWVAELTIPGGGTIRLSRDADPGWTAALIQAVRAVC